MMVGQERPVLDIMLWNYVYPFEVDFYHLNSQQQDLKMAYMDVRAPKEDGKTVVLSILGKETQKNLQFHLKASSPAA